MVDSLRKLTDGLIIFSVLVSDFEKLDFKNDALAGVRANYFNSKNSAQHDTTEVSIDDKVFSLSYNLSAKKPLSWKVTKSHRPYQSVKRETGGVYCVIFYGENGLIYKRQYFDSNHIWIRTEYFGSAVKNNLVCRIYPKNIDNIVTLQLEKLNSDGSFSVSTLFPSDKNPNNKCQSLIYSNVGMLWYDESFKPDDLELDNSCDEQDNAGFNFRIENFSPDAHCDSPIDLSNAEYLESPDTSGENDNQTMPETAAMPESYSAYDKIEKILTEASKTNKDLFGEIVNNVCFENGDSISEENSAVYDLTDETAENTEPVLVTQNLSNPEEETVKSDIEITETDNITDNNLLNEDDEAVNPEFIKREEPPCDVIIHTKSGRYSYYGAVDKDNCRVGRGRTVTPAGLTSYDGEYKNDLRDGFGVCYYKDGQINYVGNWQDGNRNGAGVGYRLSDGTMHAGKWNSNAPHGCGARFDSEGNFIDICEYDCGVRNGVGVEFNENGDIVVSKWKDGEKISEFTVETGDKFD